MLGCQDVVQKCRLSRAKISCLGPLVETWYYTMDSRVVPVTMVIGTLTTFSSSPVSTLVSTRSGGTSSSKFIVLSAPAVSCDILHRLREIVECDQRTSTAESILCESKPLRQLTHSLRKTEGRRWEKQCTWTVRPAKENCKDGPPTMALATTFTPPAGRGKTRGSS
jgi:hypothetical protein